MLSCTLTFYSLLYRLAVAQSAFLKAGKDISRFYATQCLYFRFASTLAESKIPQR